MKNTLIKKIGIALLFIITLTISANVAFAKKTDGTVKVDDLFKKTSVESSTANTAQLQNIENLPDKRLDEGVAIAIKTVLRWSFYLTIISIVVAGIYYIISMGKDESVTKAKDVILYLIIGMAIISAAYGIISGVSRFNFFSADIPTDPIANQE